MILNKDLKKDVIYKDRLSGDKVLVTTVEEREFQAPKDNGPTKYTHVDAQRYNRVTGEIDACFWPADNQLERT